MYLYLGKNMMSTERATHATERWNWCTIGQVMTGWIIDGKCSSFRGMLSLLPFSLFFLLFLSYYWVHWVTEQLFPLLLLQDQWSPITELSEGCIKYEWNERTRKGSSERGCILMDFLCVSATGQSVCVWSCLVIFSFFPSSILLLFRMKVTFSFSFSCLFFASTSNVAKCISGWNCWSWLLWLCPGCNWSDHWSSNDKGIKRFALSHGWCWRI